MTTSNGLRALPLRKRLGADRRAVVATVVIIAGAIVLFAALDRWLPAGMKVVEWIFGTIAAIVAVGEIILLVRNFRRRRRWHPPIPSATTELTRDERLAAQILSEIVFEVPADVAEGRAKGDIVQRIGPHIHAASEQFFFIAGENPETEEAFRSQLARVIAGGDRRLTDGWTRPD
jgi:type IV secretory pathway TrbD component